MDQNSTSNTQDWIFNSETVRIIIGDSKAECKVHTALLEQTTFFQVECPVIKRIASSLGQERSDTVQNELIDLVGNTSNEATDETLESSLLISEDDEVKRDAKSRVLQAEEEVVLVSSSTQASPSDSCYHFPERGIFSHAAYGLFLKYLYSKTISLEVDQDSMGTILRSWLIARRYECTSLQIELLDKLRHYHTEHPVALDSLTWVAERTGSDIYCKLLAYLVDQVAYEILLQGFGHFSKKNPHFHSFLVAKDRPVRLHLFRSLTRFGRDKKLRNPATNPRGTEQANMNGR